MPECDGWCGECYSNGRGRSNYRGHVGYRRPRSPRVLKPWEYLVKKPASDSSSASGVVGRPSQGAVLSPYPLLWEMLVEDAWDDGSARQRASMLVVCDGGSVKLWLNDKALDRSCWVSGESLEDALGSLEALIYSDSAPWRINAQKKPGKK